MEKLKLDIVGMHCGACATLIQMNVSGIDGVKSAFVDYNTNKAELEFDPGKANKDQIFKAIEEVGYKASIAI